MFRRSKKFTVEAKPRLQVFEDARSLVNDTIDRLTIRATWLEDEIRRLTEELRYTDETLGALVDARAGYTMGVEDISLSSVDVAAVEQARAMVAGQDVFKAPVALGIAASAVITKLDEARK